MAFLNPPNFRPHAELVHRSVSTLIAEIYPTDFDDPNFLEPAHVHNPEIVSHIVDLPASLLQSVPNSFQDALAAIQESTSVAYASSSRLKDLVKQCYSRLVPAKNQHELDGDQIWTVKYSEPAFFNYTNQLQAEKRYLLEEALPDWRHKAARVSFEIQRFDVPITLRDKDGKEIELRAWWTALQRAVKELSEEAEDTDIPDFEDKVAEYRHFQSKEIKKTQAREQRWSRKILLDLAIPEPKTPDKCERQDSGIGIATTVNDEVYKFAT